MPQLGATFYPGGVDDYYMPEVVAPAPQRVMPEVPQNMQEDLQRMESSARRTDATQQPGHQRVTSMSAAVETVPPENSEFKPFQDDTPIEKMSSLSLDSAPSFSPFPKVKGDNIPPSDEAKEEILYSARQHVLHSSNVSMQLSWARDALAYVEVAAENAARENPNAPRAQTPRIEHELRVDAVNIVNYLASQDHPEALFIRSKWMEFGKFGRRVDKKEAYLGYKRAAEQGWGRAEYRMGMLYENSNDLEKAVVHYHRGLDLNDSAAAYRLGMMYLLGQHGYRKDYQRGLDLIRQAAETADEDAPQGAYVYGMLIARDLPDMDLPEAVLPYDAVTSKLYVEKAAYLGFSKAQLKMGQAYELCQLGCDFNPSYSLHYYGLAARQGNSEAALGVSRWFLFGYEGYFAKNEQLAYQYAQQAATDKIPTGYFAMGYFYEIGIYVRKDLAEARRWYEMAAENGNKDAEKRIESLDSNSSLSKEDHETKTLDRIKSKHGSMKGKRPERFAKKNQVMPALNEGDGSPMTSPGLQPRRSPGPSPGQSPRQYPHDGVEFPDPERMVQKPPAFTININNQGLPPRSSSTAPYPEDSRPAPLNINRPRSTAPYPEDDVSGRPGPGGALGPGPRADRPQSAFGIRPPNLNGGGGRGGPGLAPGAIPPAGTNPARGGRLGPGGRGGAPGPGREPQAPGGYPANNGPPYDYRRDPYREDPPYDDRMGGRGGPAGPGGPPSQSPGQNRLHKNNPGRPPPGQFPMGAYGPGGGGGSGGGGGYGPGPEPQANPGRDYGVGPRTSSRPAAGPGPGPGPGSRMSDEYNRPGSTRPDHGSIPPRVDSMGGSGRPGGRPSPGPGPMGPGGRPPPQQLQDRPSQVAQQAMDGRQSAPPGPGAAGGGRPPPSQRPPMASSQSSSTVNTTQSAPSKPQSQGPATFDEMGIKPGKDKDDCVVM